MDDDSRISRWLAAGLVLVAAIGAAVIVMSSGGRTAGGDQPPVKAAEDQASREGSSIDTTSASAGVGISASTGAAGENGAGAVTGPRAPEAVAGSAGQAESGAETGSQAAVIQIDEAESGRKADGRGQEASRPVSPPVAQRPVNRVPLDLPESTAVEPPPPPGFARLRTGSIPVERALLLDGDQVSSFTLHKRAFEPGQHRVRLESARGCVEFSVDLKSDEIVYLIWDFEQNGWRRHERVGASRTASVTPAVSSCGGGR